MTPEQFAALLGRTPNAVLDEVVPVMKKAAVNVRREWMDGAKDSAGMHAGGYPFTIRFDDVARTLTGAEVEIAPDPGKGGQANLAPILEFGTVNNPPHGDGMKAKDSEAKNLPKFIAQAVAKAWREAG